MLLNYVKKAVASVLVALSLVSAADAAEKLSSAWIGEHETFVAWYAKQNGWDKEAGFELSMMPFDSGKNIVESLAAYDWAVAGCGAVPALTTPLSDYLYIVAVANDESESNAIYVRKDSPIFKVLGMSPAYPLVHGSAATVSKAEILYPKGTSAHYLLSSWLHILGLSEKDVKLTEMDPTPALSAFNGGVGDAVALWAPLTYEAEAKGYKSVANSQDCGLTQLVLLVANRRFADKHPEQVQAFLKMYIRGIEAMRSVPEEKLAAEYVRFHKEWTGKDLSMEMATLELRSHKVFTLDEQLSMMAPSGNVQKTLGEIVDFSIAHGSFTPDQIDKMKGKTRPEPRFLEAVK